MEGVYFLPPVYWPDGFGQVEDETGQSVVVAWCLPITAKEAHFVRERGRDAFEDILAAVQPDLALVGRASIV